MMRSLLALILLLALPAGALAETVYVSNGRSKMLGAPGFRASVVTPLRQGTALSVINKRKFWYQVETNGRQGWVFSYNVSKTPPMRKVAMASSRRNTSGYGVRQRASVVTTVGAVRGLTADDRSRVGSTGRSDYQALEKIDSLNLSDAEVSRFLLEVMPQ